MIHSDILYIEIKTEEGLSMRANRSKKIHRVNVKKDGRADYLYQWSYSREGSNGCAYKFVSIIKRQGKFYVDKPYYCYSGEHRLRQIHGKIVLAIKTAVFRQKIEDIVKKFKVFIKNILIKTIHIIDEPKRKFHKRNPADPFGIYFAE